MSQLARVAKHLSKTTKGTGITPARLATLSKVPLATVYKRVHDLRTRGDHPIYSNYRTVKGKKTMYYKFDGTK